MRTSFRDVRRQFCSCAMALIVAGTAACAASIGFAIEDEIQQPTPSVFLGASDDLPTGNWYVDAQAVALQRLGGIGQAASLGTSPTGAVALGEDNLNDPFEPGVQLLFGHKFGDSPYSVEISYLWLATADATGSTSDPTNNLYSPFSNFGTPPLATVDQNSLVQVEEISKMQTGEINFIKQLELPKGDPQVSLLFGIRHLDLAEEFDYFSIPSGNPNLVSVHAHTNNHLWGPQIGGKVCYGDEGAWLEVKGVIGLMDNQTNKTLTASIDGVTPTHPQISQSNTAEVGDFSATFLWRPTCNLTASFGYRALWIDEVALASRNYIYDTGTLTSSGVTPAIDYRGTLFYHGPFVALQVHW